MRGIISIEATSFGGVKEPGPGRESAASVPQNEVRQPGRPALSIVVLQDPLSGGPC
ncbi:MULTISPECIES: hypothetical protein [Tenebrionibacter/Tenebrionicola group]|uniref:hypothetical protein n=1 Tax=Tenebrionibacter/Tenebrionicola group TaxID=2969848 RepID=UPI001EE904BA|nr:MULTISPECIES: hypothetical protein [Tenebrionibacter/Tenebrionicola group]